MRIPPTAPLSQSVTPATHERGICLVGCCGPKASTACPAKDLYRSPLFRAAMAYALRFDKWFILSARHGLIHPDQVIEPYDQRLPPTTTSEHLVWTGMVRRQLIKVADLHDRVVVLAGKDYAAAVEWWALERPLKGLGIGQRLRWLRNATDTTLAGAA